MINNQRPRLGVYVLLFGIICIRDAACSRAVNTLVGWCGDVVVVVNI